MFRVVIQPQSDLSVRVQVLATPSGKAAKEDDLRESVLCDFYSEATAGGYRNTALAGCRLLAPDDDFTPIVVKALEAYHAGRKNQTHHIWL